MDLERKAVTGGKRPALLLVDMINGFTDGASPLGTDCPDVVAANRQLLDAFRANALPVFFTTVVYHDEDQARVFRERIDALNILTPDCEWVEVDKRLAPLPGESVIEKQWASSFFKTDLNEQLRSAQADSLVVTGLTTSGCVRATVVDGMQYDFPVIVAKEAVGDRNPQAHEANLFDMHAKYAEVLSVDDILSLLDH